MDYQKQVMDQFQQVEELWSTAVDLNAVAKQEKSVCFQKTPKAQKRPGTEHQVEQICRKNGDTVEEEPVRPDVVFGQLFCIRDYLAIQEVARAKLDDDIQEKYKITTVVDDHERNDIFLLSHEECHPENDDPVVVQNAECNC